MVELTKTHYHTYIKGMVREREKIESRMSRVPSSKQGNPIQDGLEVVCHLEYGSFDINNVVMKKKREGW